MLFTSYEFIGFLAAVVAVYYVVPKRAQWGVLLAASYLFYAFCGVGYFPFLLFTTLSSWLVALVMARLSRREASYLAEAGQSLSKEERKAYRARERSRRFAWLVVGLVLNFGILAVLKYTGFFAVNLNRFLHLFGAASALPVPDLILPLGISFYTFQTMGYLIDVYRGKSEAEKNVLRLALFVSFFPQIVQGPIGRHGDLADQLYAEHRFSTADFTDGLGRVLWGYFKKLVVADRLLVLIGAMLETPETYGGMYVLLMVLGYSVEIYSDFTGGIDITIGIARMLGIRMTENFNFPFFSKSTKEYWRRWHITMGTWFTDYLFYPLSVCRPMQKISKRSRDLFGTAIGKRIPVYLATIVTWFMTGFWHGAGWNFIVWGLLNCLVILVSQELEPLYKKFRARAPRLVATRGYVGFMMLRTFLLMGFIRVLDCYRDVPLTFRMWGSLFTTFNYSHLFDGTLLTLGLGGADYILIGLCCLLMLAVSLAGRKYPTEGAFERRPLCTCLTLGALLATILIFGAYGIGYDATQFIYTQF